MKKVYECDFENIFAKTAAAYGTLFLQAKGNDLITFIETFLVNQYKKGLEEVYAFNVPLTKKQNYIPLPDIESYISCHQKEGKYVFELWIDDDSIPMRDASGEPIYKRNSKGVLVPSFDQYWQMPINQIGEETYIETFVRNQVAIFVSQGELKQYIKKLFDDFSKMKIRS